MSSEPCLLSLSLVGVAILQVEALLSGDRHHLSQHYLHQVLGNKDGCFTTQEPYFAQSARNVRLEGLALSAQLRRINGEWREDKVALEFVFPTKPDSDDVRVEILLDDRVKVPRLPRMITGDEESWNLICHEGHAWIYLDRAIPRYSHTPPVIDLNSCIGNHDGSFDTAGVAFLSSATDLSLVGSVLHARLRTIDEQWKEAALDVQEALDAGVAGARPGFDQLDIDDPRHGLPTNMSSSEATNLKPQGSLYTAIDSTTELRLCKIHPGEWTDPLVCTLVAYGDDSRNYQCLSYVWGWNFRDLRVLVNGIPLEVTANLYLALRDLRSLEEDVLYWVDAICINQEDTDEKAAQVAKMGHIYHGADRVVVWLGGGTMYAYPSHDSDPTEKAAALLQEGIRLLANRTHLHDIVELVRTKAENSPHLTDLETIVAGFQTLCESPWWKRVWTFQEVIIPENVHVLLPVRAQQSPVQFPWNILSLAATNMAMNYSECRTCRALVARLNAHASLHWTTAFASLRTCRDLYRRILLYNRDVVASDIRVSQRVMNTVISFLIARGIATDYRHTNVWNFVTIMLSYCGSHESSDLRDKIYGLLALKPNDPRNPFRPDYTLSVERVYRDFSLHMMTAARSFALWSIESANRSDTLFSPVSVPTWANDWPSKPGVQHVTAFNASWYCCLFKVTNTAWAQPIVIGDKVLSIQCMSVDVVAEVTDNRWFFTTGADKRAAAVLGQWRGFAYRSCQKSYPAGGKIEDVFWRTLLNDHICTHVERQRVANRDKTDFDIWAEVTLQTRSTLSDSEQRKFDRIDKTVERLAIGRKMISTAHGYLGMAPETARPQDVICAIQGARESLYLLRPTVSPDPDLQDHPVYTVVGHLYVHGLMHGEVDALKLQPSTINLV